MLEPQVWLSFGPVKKLLQKHKHLGTVHVLAKALKDHGRFQLHKHEVGSIVAGLLREPAQALDVGAVPDELRLWKPQVRWMSNPEREWGSVARRRRFQVENPGPYDAAAWAFKLQDRDPNTSWARVLRAARVRAPLESLGERARATTAPLPSNSGLKRLYWMVKAGQVVLRSGTRWKVLNVTVRANDYPVLDLVPE